MAFFARCMLFGISYRCLRVFFCSLLPGFCVINVSWYDFAVDLQQGFFDYMWREHEIVHLCVHSQMCASIWDWVLMPPFWIWHKGLNVMNFVCFTTDYWLVGPTDMVSGDNAPLTFLHKHVAQQQEKQRNTRRNGLQLNTRAHWGFDVLSHMFLHYARRISKRIDSAIINEFWPVKINFDYQSECGSQKVFGKSPC